MASYINDLKAPRSKKSGRFSLLSKDFLSFLLERNPEFPIKDWKTFKDVCSKGLELIAETIATTRDGVELPKMTGYILVASCDKANVKSANFNSSSIYGKKIINTNLETDGRLAKILYTNYPIKYRIRYRELWQFEPCRFFKRTVSRKFKDNPDNYIKLSKTEKLSWRFNKKHIINNKNY